MHIDRGIVFKAWKWAHTFISAMDHPACALPLHLIMVDEFISSGPLVLALFSPFLGAHFA